MIRLHLFHLESGKTKVIQSSNVLAFMIKLFLWGLIRSKKKWGKVKIETDNETLAYHFETTFPKIPVVILNHERS